MAQAPITTDDEDDHIDIIHDARTLAQVIAEQKPGERIVIQQVVSVQGISVHAEEATILPTITNGALMFDCIFTDGDRLCIHHVDSYLWSVENVQ